MFSEVNSVRREVKVLHKWEQEGIFIFSLMFENHVHYQLNVHRLKWQHCCPLSIAIENYSNISGK